MAVKGGAFGVSYLSLDRFPPALCPVSFPLVPSMRSTKGCCKRFRGRSQGLNGLGFRESQHLLTRARLSISLAQIRTVTSAASLPLAGPSCTFSLLCQQGCPGGLGGPRQGRRDLAVEVTSLISSV